jgi:hypothetical protein
VSVDEEWRTPTTGIVGCCARAAIGQAAAPPRIVMNSRRLICSLSSEGTAYHNVHRNCVVQHSKFWLPMTGSGQKLKGSQ